MDTATLFLMLALVITKVRVGVPNDLIVKITRSKLSFFYFLFNLFPIILFLELGLGLE